MPSSAGLRSPIFAHAANVAEATEGNATVDEDAQHLRHIVRSPRIVRMKIVTAFDGAVWPRPRKLAIATKVSGLAVSGDVGTFEADVRSSPAAPARPPVLNWTEGRERAQDNRPFLKSTRLGSTVAAAGGAPVSDGESRLRVRPVRYAGVLLIPGATATRACASRGPRSTRPTPWRAA